MNSFTYEGKYKRELSFPLGGIGTGSIGLSGSGRLVEWQMFGHPDLYRVNGISHFAVKAEQSGKLLDARILNGDLDGSFIGNESGPSRDTMAGLPHFKDLKFEGNFPIAELTYQHDKFPGIVRQTAFNPFIPMNADDSTIPAAAFSIEIENTQSEALDYTIALTLINPATPGRSSNYFRKDGALSSLYLTGNDKQQDDLGYVDMTGMTDCSDVSYQEYLFRGIWFDQITMLWNNFTESPRFTNRTYPQDQPGQESPVEGGVLAAHISVGPGEKKAVRFVISWNVPNMVNYWDDRDPRPVEERPTWKHYYAKLFSGSQESARYLLQNYDRLYTETKAFQTALLKSTLPSYVAQAISANLAILKSPTCYRLENGEFWAFEGCNETTGSCYGSCTHVWNYAYALAFLFPALERSMRDLNYEYNYYDGAMQFRLQLPPGGDQIFRACVDGQMGDVYKVYRDWKICGDDAWLKKLWPKVKKTIEFAWSEQNPDGWDLDRDGVMEGRQHHTLDVEMFGPNAWLNGFYLLALLCGAEMAQHLGEADFAAELTALFEKGKAYTDSELFNGEFYSHKIDLTDRNMLDFYQQMSDTHGGNFPFVRTTQETYWDDEVQQMKYQLGDGCLSDQLLAQWHANLAGLGRIFDPKKAKKALSSIYKYNFRKQGFRDYANPCRLYAINDEPGLLVCSWPEGHESPKIPLPYSQEVFNGIEYATAALMIQEGEVKKGLSIAKAARSRYKGDRRNPWNEMECGGYYARSLSSYSLLLALSGFEYDMTRRHLGFAPVKTEKSENDQPYQTFFTFDRGWGVFHLDSVKKRAQISVLYGEMSIESLHIANVQARKATVAGQNLPFDLAEDDRIVFSKPLSLQKGDTLEVRLRD